MCFFPISIFAFDLKLSSSFEPLNKFVLKSNSFKFSIAQCNSTGIYGTHTLCKICIMLSLGLWVALLGQSSN